MWDNVRAIGLYVEEKRKMGNRPVTTGQSEFATARLPPADEDSIAPPAPADNGLDEEPHEVLGVAPDAPDELISAAFKTQVNKLEGHPDTGGVDRSVPGAPESQREDAQWVIQKTGKT